MGPRREGERERKGPLHLLGGGLNLNYSGLYEHLGVLFWRVLLARLDVDTGRFAIDSSLALTCICISQCT